MSLSIEMEKPKESQSPTDDNRLSRYEEQHFETFSKILKTENETRFLESYLTLQIENTHNKFHVDLLAIAIEQQRSEDVVEAILNNVNDIDCVVDGAYGQHQYIIAAVCKAKSLNNLKTLLNKDKLKLPSMLEIIDTFITDLDEELFEQWFDVIMEFDKNIDVNKHYRKDQLLLETALLQENNNAIKKLCKAGAFIGFKLQTYKDENGYLVDKMEPHILEEIFDSCITPLSDEDLNPKSKDFMIKFNYKNFVCPDESLNCENEMTPIACILNSEELIHLIKHPLITSLMTLKFLCISRIFYINIILYCFYGLSMLGYVIYKCEGLKPNSLLMLSGLINSAIGISYLIIRETIQFVRNPIYYLTNPINYFEIFLIALSIRVRTMDFEPFEAKITIVVTILCMALELALLVRYLTVLSISTHMLMLQQVLISFFKSFSLYSLFVLMFVVCFYVLFGIGNRDLALQGVQPNLIFENVFLSIPKLMAMTVGELDYASLNVHGVFGYGFFILFVVCSTVVLMNLLNGLAVSDIQTIKDQAELTELICRAKLLINHSSNFLQKYERNPKCFCKWSLHVQPNCKQCPNEVIYPANCNLCGAKGKRRVSQGKLMTIILSKDENAVFIWDSLNGKCSAMASSIVKLAIQIIKRETSTDSQETRLESIEENVKKILENIRKE